MTKWQDDTFYATFIHNLTPIQVPLSTLLKGAKVLKSAGTVSDKFNSLDDTPLDTLAQSDMNALMDSLQPDTQPIPMPWDANGHLTAFDTVIDYYRSPAL